MECMIRKFTHADTKAVVALLEMNVPLYFAHSEVADFKEYLQNHLEDYFLVEKYGLLVGAGGTNYDITPSGLARVSWDFIHPDYQGKGIGSILLQHRLSQIKEKCVPKVEVRTSQLAYKFYQKNGFEMIRVEKDFWSKGYDLYLMHLNFDGKQ